MESNSNSKSFSESFFNYEILYTITQNKDLIYGKDLLTDSVKINWRKYFLLFFSITKTQKRDSKKTQDNGSILQNITFIKWIILIQ